MWACEICAKTGGGYAEFADVNGEYACSKRLDKSKRTIFSIAEQGDDTDWEECESTSEQAESLFELADEDNAVAKALVAHMRSLKVAVARKAGGKRVVARRTTLLRIEKGGYTDVHMDGPQFDLRSVTFWSRETDVEKRVLFGLAHDPRENDDGLSLGGRGFHYLADLVLRSGQTYLGDVVAMGGRPVGRGVGGNRALVHKVEPGASSQVVLIVDWGVEEDA